MLLYAYKISRNLNMLTRKITLAHLRAIVYIHIHARSLAHTHACAHICLLAHMHTQSSTSKNAHHIYIHTRAYV